MSEKENYQKEKKNTKEKKSTQKEEKTQNFIAPPIYDASKNKVTMGLSNDESTIGGSDMFQPNFPDSQN